MHLYFSLNAQNSSGLSTGPGGCWTVVQCCIRCYSYPTKKGKHSDGGSALPEAHVNPVWLILDLGKM